MDKGQGGKIHTAHLYTFEGLDQLSGIVQSDTLINTPNTYGRLYVHNEKFTLVPDSLFDPSHKDLYLSFCTHVQTEDLEVFYEGIYSNSIQILGGIEKTTLKKLDAALPDLEVTSGAAFHLAFLLERVNESSGEELYIFPLPGSIYLAALKDGKLLLFNIFKVNGENHLLKYLFSAIQQLGFRQENTNIHIIGSFSHILCDDDLLQNYFKNVHNVPLSGNVEYSEGAEDFKNTNLLEAYWAK